MTTAQRTLLMRYLSNLTKVLVMYQGWPTGGGLITSFPGEKGTCNLETG